ncbi:hypothetical protein D3C76_1702940 [compost metagenome]
MKKGFDHFLVLIGKARFLYGDMREHIMQIHFFACRYAFLQGVDGNFKEMAVHKRFIVADFKGQFGDGHRTDDKIIRATAWIERVM